MAKKERETLKLDRSRIRFCTSIKTKKEYVTKRLHVFNYAYEHVFSKYT